MAEPSTRAKWRALRSARVSTLKKCLTAPTLSEMRFFTNNPSKIASTPRLSLTGYYALGRYCYTPHPRGYWRGGRGESWGRVRGAGRDGRRPVCIFGGRAILLISETG